MTDACDARCELYELANAQLEDRLTAEQGTRLEGLVLGSHSLRRQYLVYMEVNAAARWIGRRLDTASPAGALPLSTPVDFPGAGNDIANHFWQPGLSSSALFYAIAFLLCAFLLVAASLLPSFRPVGVAAKPAQPPVLVAGQYTQNVTRLAPAAGPEPTTAAPGKLAAPPDRPMAGDGSRAPETMHVRSAGGRESRIPLPASGEAALPDAALFSVPTDQLDSEWNIEIDKPAVYGKCVLRGKVRLWSEDGKDGQSILTEKAGATSVARLVRERVVVAMMRRTGFEHRGRPTAGPGPDGGETRGQTVIATRERGFKILPQIVTMATPADDLNGTSKSKGKPADNDLPPLPTGVRYASSAAFKLADASPHTVELWCWYFTHYRLSAIRLNGKSLSVPKQASDSSVGRLFEFSSNEGFVQGTNTLEIDVDDLSPQASAAGGPPRFYLALAGFWMAPGVELELPKPAGATDGNSADHTHAKRGGR